MNNLPEQPSKSLTRVIGEGVAAYSAGSFINKIAGVASSLIKIRYLTIFQYGLLSLTYAAVYLFNGFITLGITEAVVSDLNRYKGDSDPSAYKTLFKGYLKFVTLMAVLLWAILFFGAEYISSFYDNSILPYIKIFSFILLITPIRNIFTVVFQTHLKFNTLVKWSVFESYTNLILVVILVWIMGLGIKGVLYGELIYHVLSIFIFIYPLNKTGAYLLKVKSNREPIFWQTLKNHGKWALFNNYLGDFTNRIRPWLIAFFLNVEAVAIFTVAKNIFTHLTSLVPVQQVVSQIFSQNIKDRIKVGGIFIRSFKYSLFIYTFIGLISLVLVPVLVYYLFPKYLISLPIFYILLIMMPITALSVIQNPMYNAIRRQRDLFGLTLIRNIFIIILLVLLLPLFGIAGAAWENVITTHLYSLLRYFNLKRHVNEIKINLSNIFSFDELDRVLVKKVLFTIKSKLGKV